MAALAGLARCYLKSGDVERAEQTLGLVPPDKRETGPVASVRAALDLAKLAGKAGDADKLKAKVEAEPANHQARIDYAMALAAGRPEIGSRGSAAGELPPRSQVERGGGAQAARAAVRRLGSEGPRHARGAAQAVVDFVLVESASGVAVQKFSERYQGPADLPQRIPVFPLRGAILLPRATLPLNIFEPRYLQMVDDVMSTSRVLGMVQPDGGEEESPAGRTVPLRRIGCAGRITGYQELDDGRLMITLTGIARFTLVDEVPLDKAYRICTVSYDKFLGDFRRRRGRG